eukprot:COSAG02_NODE_1506_length_12232_cov_420.616088_13_plen_164_part_00
MQSMQLPQQSNVDDTSLVQLVLEEHKLLLQREEKMQARADKLREEAKVEMDELRQEMQQQMEKLCEELKPAPPPSISNDQIATLQARLEALHAAELLTEVELDALEDIVMEYVEVKASPAAASGDMHAQASLATCDLWRLLAISEAVATDAVFARQVWRRFNL